MSDSAIRGGLTHEEKQVFFWAKALVCELYDTNHMPPEADALADALDRLCLLPERVRRGRRDD